MLPHRTTGITTEYVRVLDLNEIERNDLWLNIKGNYIFFIGNILLNLDLNN